MPTAGFAVAVPAAMPAAAPLMSLTTEQPFNEAQQATPQKMSTPFTAARPSDS
jgi:hypothetical protein